MASIFTYDPDPPRVASPWLTSTESSKPSTPQPKGRRITNSCEHTPSGQLAEYGVTRLEPEPQDGPTEYKLHLMLRPRRNYSSSSTGYVTSGSQQSKQQPPDQAQLSGPILAPSNQSRQNRLEQLTTQLLWRLQQSSPYHASSTSDLVLPKLPEAKATLGSPPRPGKLLAGLEQSRGALYEIGVSDDGTFVGLTKDEMDESLTNLRAMAASLGCNVEVVRMVIVGECEWNESKPTTRPKAGEQISKLPTISDRHPEVLRHQAQLWVAEALVTPDLSSKRNFRPMESTLGARQETNVTQFSDLVLQDELNTSDEAVQLRITLTGPSTSGKTSLLGTLATATLDNGRGKSRISHLRHRHEIESGVTSSISQELLGYSGLDVVNYASGNVTSWTDIHASAEHGRLVFISDTAGHQKYRRTICKGLVGWAPHWTFLCIAADEGEAAALSVHDALEAEAGIDMARAHLELCLKFDKPLAIVITKFDLVSTTRLKQTLSKILTALKAAGRTPSLIPPDRSRVVYESDLKTIPQSEADAVVRHVVDKITVAESLSSIVPILMVSATKGTGIRSLHALLSLLPIPSTPTSRDFVGSVLNPEQPASLFHIEEVFELAASMEPLAPIDGKQTDLGVVVAGHLRFGHLGVGDIVVVGPFPAETDEIDSPSNRSGTKSSPVLGASFPHSSSVELARMASRNAISASVTKGEWHHAHIVSLRNLRLPVHTLKAGQVGTIGVVFDIPEEEISDGPFLRPSPTAPRLRKGLVISTPSEHMRMTGQTLQAGSGFTASFDDSDINSVTPGSLVVVYIASVRASAKVLRLVPHSNDGAILAVIGDEKPEDADVFGLDENFEEQGPDPSVFGSDGVTDVTFELMTSREWIELGSQVLVMPGGGHGLYYGSERGEKGIAGLEGFVGKVIEVID